MASKTIIFAYMRIKLTTIFAALFLLSCSRQTDNTALPFPEGSITVGDRISNQRVNAFTQDADGHIWMATGRGLDKYTGSEFYQYFSTSDTLGLPDNQVMAVHAAQNGDLWAGTVNGLARRSPDGEFHRVVIPGKFVNIAQILETPGGRVLASTGNALYASGDATDDMKPVIRDFDSFTASALVQGERLWVISGGGFTLNAYSTKDFSLLESIPLPFQAYHMCAFGAEELWLSGMGQLRILDTRNMAWKELPTAIRKESRLMNGDTDILFALDGQSLLLNVIGEGFFLYSRSREALSREGDAGFPFDVPSSEVRTIFRDRSGNLWFGTTDKGYHVSYNERGLFGGNKALTSFFKGKNVTALCPDHDGGLWICTLRDGLFRYDIAGKTVQAVPIGHLIPDSGVGYIRTSGVYSDSDGDLWLLFQEKVRVIRCRWDGRRLVPKDVVYAAYPLCVQEDDRGAFWIGGFSPVLVRFDKHDGSRQDIPVSLDWTFVTDLVQKEPGKMIAACFGMPPRTVNTYSLEVAPEDISALEEASCVSRSVIIPNVLMKDNAGNIWIGTYANGLITRRGGKLQPVPGTPCQDIASIEEDRQGNIWVSTLNGLGKLDVSTNGFVHFFEADGIGGDQFNDRASCILPDGTLVFGGTHGLTAFNPLDAPARRTVPLVFESLSVHNRMVRALPGNSPVVIRHSENAFGISFAALDYSPFEQIRYAYKLEGFDKDWVKIGTRHDAYFANLPAGDYTLRVRITNGSRSITESEASIPVKVLPPWYASWWGICLWALLGVFFIGIVYTFYRHVRRVRKEAARRIREVRREREKAEEAEKAEKALNKIQMNYFANVAHEFRTPLTMIAGPAQQLSASGTISGENRQLVDIIRRNATWMLSLVNQLLDFNRIGNSKLQMKVAKIDIMPHLRDIVSLFRYNADSKGIELSSYGLEDSFTMWADVDKVQKMVMNLLSNALKYTPSGGKVTLGFDVVPRGDAAALFPLTDADTDGQWALLSVADTGPGIPEDQLEKIFERFYQTTGGKAAGGSGIGLFYARALSGLHHGYIKAWNRDEGGAVFRILLPVSAASYSEEERTAEAPVLPLHAIAESAPAAESARDEGKRHVVVVDDDIDIANYLKVLLRPYYRVTLYFDGAGALKGMEEDSPDLVISDVVMPGMDGYELCRSIKENLQLSHIPVVLVTAKVAVESQVEGLHKGADAYVTKPFQPAYLLALVKSLLENREKLHRQLGSVTTTEDIAPEALSPRDAAFMKELYELMEKELSNADLDIVRITEMMKISRTKFYYKVKGLTGENPSVFFKRYKLNRAADLLREGKHNMSEIAWMTGFNTLSHFSTSFKKQFGVPPSEYAG